MQRPVGIRHSGESQNPMYAHVDEEDDSTLGISSSHVVDSKSIYRNNRPMYSPVFSNKALLPPSMLIMIFSIAIIMTEVAVLIWYQSSTFDNTEVVVNSITSQSSSSIQISPLWERVSSPTKSGYPFLYVDDSDVNSSKLYGKIPIEWVTNKQPLLFVEQITSGIGLQSLFWDPGNILSQNLCHFSFVDDHNYTVMLTVSNTNYRSKNSSLIRQSFSDAIIWKGDVLHREDNHIWMDLQNLFYLIPGIFGEKSFPEILTGTYGSSAMFSMDHDRSFVTIPPLHNSSAESTLAADLHATFIFSNENSYPTPDFTNNLALGHILTTTVRRSLHCLGNNKGKSKYQPRRYHPKSGSNYVSFMNEDASIFSNRQELLVVRHHVSATSEEEQGILYLVDSLIPEPFRSAVIEGVRWWDAAFQSAGFSKHTLQAYVAPASFDPYDLFRGFNTQFDLDMDSLSVEDKNVLSAITISKFSRVHFVQWIDRDIRSYSVGLRVIDPRSGEILRGHVRLEGLRLRQDVLLAETLLAPYSVNGAFYQGNAQEADIQSMVLQRVKHLGAHEVGHSLGLAHNFAGSTYNRTRGIASVMDYPPPMVQIIQERNNHSSLALNSRAYSNGIGDFDKVTIQYAYQPLLSKGGETLNTQDEWMRLLQIIANAEHDVRYVFATDQESSVAGANWQDTKWDLSGANPINALKNALQIRELGLQTIGIHVLHNASALAALRQMLPIVYLWHRYEAEAVAKLIGGHSVEYSLRDDVIFGSNSVRNQPVNASLQWQAIDALVHAMMPNTLGFPQATIVSMTQSVAFGYLPDIGGSGDLFASRRGSLQELDPLVMYESGVQLILEYLLNPYRLERIAQQQYLYSQLEDSRDGLLFPNLFDYFDRIFSLIFPPLPGNATNATETCEFLVNNLSYEYFILLTSWKTALKNVVDKSKASNASLGSLSTIAVAGVQYAVTSIQQTMVQLQDIDILVCDWRASGSNSSPSLIRAYSLMLKSISTMERSSSVRIPNGPPI